MVLGWVRYDLGVALVRISYGFGVRLQCSCGMLLIRLRTGTGTGMAEAWMSNCIIEFAQLRYGCCMVLVRCRCVFGTVLVWFWFGVGMDLGWLWCESGIVCVLFRYGPCMIMNSVWFWYGVFLKRCWMMLVRCGTVVG